MTTTTSNSQVIVSVGPCECHEVESVHAYHRNFPETKVEGDSESQALERLQTQMELALEHLPSGHGRQEMEAALQDIREMQSGRRDEA